MTARQQVTDFTFRYWLMKYRSVVKYNIKSDDTDAQANAIGWASR